MNLSQNRTEATRNSRYDFSTTATYISNQEKAKSVPTPSGDTIDYTEELVYLEGGRVTVDVGIANYYAQESNPIFMDSTPITGFGGYTGSVDMSTIDADPATVENPIYIYSPDPLYGDYGGLIEGWADVPSGAARELYTTFQDISAYIVTVTQDGVSTEYLKIVGEVGASSGTVTALLEEDIYYQIADTEVNADGSFQMEFEKPDGYREDDNLRLRHPSTREWYPGVGGEYIYTDYEVDLYREIDTDYYLGSSNIFVDGNTWEFDVPGSDTDALIEIYLRNQGTQVGKPWRRSYNVYDILRDYEVVYKVVTRGLEQDRAPVASNGDFIIAARDFSYPYRIWIEDENGNRVTPIWHVDANGDDLFSNLYVVTYVTADILYEVDRVPLGVNGQIQTWKEGSTTLSSKLIYNEDEFPEPDNTTDVPYARTQSATRMPRSYDVPKDDPAFESPFANRAYTYDIALCLLVYTFNGNQAKASEYVDVLSRLLLDNGMMVFFASQGQFAGLTPYERVGAAAWVDYALAKYVKEFPGAANAADAEATCRANLDRIISEYEVTDSTAAHYGLYTGGKGRYAPNDDGVYVFDPDYVAPWVATEHMVDMFFAFQAAADAFDDANYDSRADDVYTDSIDVLWSEDEDRYYQGAVADGVDDRGALDCHTWGSVLLNQFGDFDRRDKALARLPVYESFSKEQGGVYGYPPYVEEEGHPNAGEDVWFEGSFGAVHALRRAGREAEGLALGHQLSAVNVDPFNSYQYGVRGDAQQNTIVEYPSIASSMWGILAMEYPDKMWSETP